MLFDGHTPNALPLRATLAGVCHGRVVVDDARRPSQALLRTNYATTFGARDPAVPLGPLVRSLPRGHRLQRIDALSLTECLWRGTTALYVNDPHAQQAGAEPRPGHDNHLHVSWELPGYVVRAPAPITTAGR